MGERRNIERGQLAHLVWSEASEDLITTRNGDTLDCFSLQQAGAELLTLIAHHDSYKACGYTSTTVDGSLTHT